MLYLSVSVCSSSLTRVFSLVEETLMSELAQPSYIFFWLCRSLQNQRRKCVIQKSIHIHIFTSLAAQVGESGLERFLQIRRRVLSGVAHHTEAGKATAILLESTSRYRIKAYKSARDACIKHALNERASACGVEVPKPLLVTAYPWTQFVPITSRLWTFAVLIPCIDPLSLSEVV